MFNIQKRPSWYIPERSITPEAVVANRRYFLKKLGFAGAGLLTAVAAGCSKQQSATASPELNTGAGAAPAETNKIAASSARAAYPAPRNPDFNPAWPLTDEETAANYNNFYEFTTSKTGVRRLTDRFVIAPWPLEITGLVENPMSLDAQELIDQMTLEERIYRFRCVEAWAMVVPWTGFQLSKLLDKVKPKPEARFVRFVTFNRPDQAPGLRDSSYPWPYTEGLRLDEAMHPLTLVATGIYGKPLPKQHGAPIRLVVPWKYGYKSIKSIVKIELVAQQPKTLWETMAPHEYPFESNVDPAVPHPRWSQATERMIDTGVRVRTLKHNGYADLVAKLY